MSALFLLLALLQAAPPSPWVQPIPPRAVRTSLPKALAVVAPDAPASLAIANGPVLHWSYTNVATFQVVAFIVQHHVRTDPFTNMVQVASGWTSGMTNAASEFLLAPAITMDEHHFRVIAQDIYGNLSPPSAEAQTPNALPDPPRIDGMISVFTAHEGAPVNSSDFKLIWTPAPSDTELQVQHYIVEHIGANLVESTWTDNTDWTPVLSVYSQLSEGIRPVFSAPVGSYPSTLHRFRVKAQNIWGESPPSDAIESPPGGLPVKLRTTITVTVQ